MKVQTITQYQFTYLGTQRSWIGSSVRVVGQHVSNILSEDGGHERAVPAVGIPVQQLRRHVHLKLSTSRLSLSLSLRLGLNLSLRLGLSLSLVHSCSCIKN
jgi:hypothetical protein